MEAKRTPGRDPRLVEAAEKAAAHFNGKDGFANSGRINLYRCEHDASHVIVTKDLEPGVTSFTVECPFCRAKRTPGRGFYRHPAMQSAMYRAPQDLQPTHYWFRPDTFDGFNPGTVEHLLKGGLVLRVSGVLPADDANPAQDSGPQRAR